MIDLKEIVMDKPVLESKQSSLNNVQQYNNLISVFRLSQDSPPERILRNVLVADTFYGRFMGLMGRKTLEPLDGLLLVPCASIHTCFMRFPIDVVCLDSENMIIDLLSEMAQYSTFTPRRGTRAVLELQAESIYHIDLHLADHLVMRKNNGIEPHTHAPVTHLGAHEKST